MSERHAGPVLLGCMIGGLLLLLLLAVAVNPQSEPELGTPQREPETMTFRGVVTESGLTAISGRPYFDVALGGRSVTCQYVSGAAPAKGAWVTVAGKAVVWVSGSGTFRPCVIIGR